MAIDIAVQKDGYHGDMNVTTGVGEIGGEARHLTDATRQALNLGLECCVLGKRLGDVGNVIQTFVEAEGLSVVREYCGHGLGRSFHEEPQLLHYGDLGTGRRLQAGMVFTVEPMVNSGEAETRLLEDNWTRGYSGWLAFGAIRAHRGSDEERGRRSLQIRRPAVLSRACQSSYPLYI